MLTTKMTELFSDVLKEQVGFSETWLDENDALAGKGFADYLDAYCLWLKDQFFVEERAVHELPTPDVWIHDAWIQLNGRKFPESERTIRLLARMLILFDRDDEEYDEELAQILAFTCSCLDIDYLLQRPLDELTLWLANCCRKAPLIEGWFYRSLQLWLHRFSSDSDFLDECCHYLLSLIENSFIARRIFFHDVVVTRLEQIEQEGERERKLVRSAMGIPPTPRDFSPPPKRSISEE